jgi:hypothetical protein
MRGLVIYPGYDLTTIRLPLAACMLDSAFVARRPSSPEPVRLCDEMSLVFRDRLIGAQCPLYLSGERTHTGEWEFVWLVVYGEITSPPHLFPQRFYLFGAYDFEVPSFPPRFID